MEKDQTWTKVGEEKTRSVNIESDQEEKETNKIYAPTEPATTLIPSPLTTPVSKQDSEINKLIDDLTKSNDEKNEVLINYLKRKQRYKHAARKPLPQTEEDADAALSPRHSQPTRRVPNKST
ncbi:hypothetical protein PVK06_047070 [Gossypium arboreum]|uniref:Uncharacterized protein n=1 Tax=Gossypium arboreum TaxID=29729 RepID=A0ABR0MCV8_GOSAR|nr:hypothetical protein PVK06_047070 [Gossypium arboreum]